MARTELQKAEVLDNAVLLAASRLRLRALALINGAMTLRGVQKATLAKRLGVRRTAVQHTLDGNGNVTLQTLAEYLGVLGVEVDLVPVESGEIATSMRSRRAPRILPLTLRDRDWHADAVVVGENRAQPSQVWGQPSSSGTIHAPSTQYALSRDARVRVKAAS